MPSTASTDERYTSLIIACVCARYKGFNCLAPVSTVSLIRSDWQQIGITGISGKENSPEQTWVWSF